MAEKKTWRDYSEMYSTEESTEKETDNKKTGGWRDYSRTYSGEESTNDYSSSSWRSYSNTDFAAIAGDGVVNRVNNWLSSHNALLSSHQDRYSNRKFTYEDAYVGDSRAWLDTVNQERQRLNAEADSIIDYLYQNQNYLDADWMKEVIGTLNKAREDQGQLSTFATKDFQTWSKWENEDAYKAEVNANKDYTEKVNLDTEAYEKELEDLGNLYDESIGIGLWYDDYQRGTLSPDTDPAEIERKLGVYNRFINEFGGDEKAVKAAYDSKEKYLNEAKQVQATARETEKWNSYTQAEDFEEYAAIGAAIENPSWKEAFGIWIGPWQIGGEDIGNIVTFSRDNITEIGSSSLVGNSIYNHMTEDEVKLYNYLLAKEGNEVASSYLSYLEPRLKSQEGQRLGNIITSINIPVVEDLAILSHGLAAGVDQWASNTGAFFTGEEVSPSITQYANSYISDSLDGIGYHAHQAATNIGNMAPSILVSTVLGGVGAPAAVAQGVGAATMGVSAAGGAYSNALKQGYDKASARTYSTLVGAAEGALQYLLGGISSLGGMSGKLATKVAAIDNALLRASARLSLSIGSEILEEELQNYLEPAFRTIIFGEDYDAPTIEELIDTAIVTALSTGVLEGGGTIAEVGAEQSTKKQYGSSTKELIGQGLLSDPNSESYQLAQKYQKKIESGKSLTGAEISQLVSANEAQFAEEDYSEAAIKARTRLYELGETKDVYNLANLVAKKATGQELTRSEKSTLARSQFGEQVAKEMSTANETGTSAKSFDTKQNLTYKSLEDRVGAEVTFAVSNSGQTTIRSANEAISLDNVEVVNIGKNDMSLKVDGKEVNASDIDFADDSESHLFEAVAKIENITPGAATAILRDYDSSSGQTVGEYLNGVDEAYTYGYYGYSVADLKAGNFAPNLTNEQMMSAYELGKSARKISDTDADAPRVKMRTASEAKLSKKEKAAQKKSRFESGASEVYFMDGKETVKFDEHTGKYDDKRMAAVNYAKFLSKLGIGSKYYFFESYVNADGVRVYKDANGNEVEAPNGMFRADAGSIYIDLNAGDYGQGTALFTLGHELTHFIKEWSKQKFKVLADFLIEEYGKTDMSMHERVLEKQKFLEEKRGESVSYDEAFEEVVADAMSTMLTDGNLHEKLAKLKAKDKGLFNKIKEFFDKLIAKFRSVYAELDPDQRDARDVREMKDAFDRIQTAFAEALVEASENFQTAQNSTEAIENSDGTVYSKRGYAKVFFKENVFPPFDESHSDSHEVAERWARSKEGRIEKKALLSHHNEWYVIQVFDDMKYGYQIIQELTEAEYQREAKNYGTISRYESSQSAFDKSASYIRGRTPAQRAGGGVDSAQSGYRGENPRLLGVDEQQVRWGEIPTGQASADRSGSSDWGRREESSVKTLRLDELSARAKWLRKQLKRDGISSAKKTEYRRELREIQKEMDGLMQGYYPSREGKSKHSDRDSLGNKLSKGQREFFKDSKIVDENGNLKVMYHGSQESFTVFNKKKARASGYYGKGFYFTDSNSHAKQYGNTYEVYLNITNPLQSGTNDITKDQLRKFVEAIAENEDYGIDNYGESATVDSVTDSVYGKGDFAMLMDINASCVGDLVAAVELYNEVNGTDYNGIIAPTETVAFYPEQIKRVDNKAPTSDPDIRYSERVAKTDQTDIHSRIFDLQSEEGRLNRSIKEIEASEEFKAVENRMFNAASVEDGVKQYLEWKEKSGYGSLLSERDSVREELKKLREERDNTYADESAEKEKQAIAKSGLSEADYFRKKAVKEFGYTPYFYDAGYITPNGQMLNFSGEKGKHFGSRGEDHRAIGIIYENTQGSAAMIRFMNDGNIRIMAETPGLDISSSVEPTKDQYATIKKFARENGSKERYFAVDISDENGRVVGNYEYDGYVNADRVVNDIKYFFEKGEVREQSSVARFLNSERGNGTSNRSLLANAFETITKDSTEYKLIQKYKSHIKDLNALDNRLSDLNAEIFKLRFGKNVERDAARLAKIESEAKAVAKEINRQDKELLSLEASEPLRKVIERERKKEAQKTKDHVKEIQQNKKARAEQTELRHKIRKAIRDLDKLLNRGNKKRNVKEDMKGFVSKALELADYLFTDHVSNDDLIRKGITVRMTPKEAALVKETEDILAQLYDNADSLTDEEFTRLDAKRKANEDKLRDLLTAQRNERLNTPVYNLFNDLVTEYAKLQNSGQAAVKASYSAETERFLRSYIGEFDGETDTDRKTLLQNMRVADMTTDELWRLLNAYKMVLHAVRTANDLFVKSKAATLEQKVTAIATDFSSQKIPDKDLAIVARKLSNKLGWDYEKLYYALDRIGSEAFTELFMNLADSENIVMQDVREAVAFRDKMVDKYGYNNWAVDKKLDREFLDNTGKKFKLSLGEIMALYAYSRRENAWNNIEYGGFAFGKAELTNPKPADTYKLTKEQGEAIFSLLTKEQKGYAVEMQKYLSETMGAKGNEVSMLLHGIEMFREKDYFPLHIYGAFKAQADEAKAKEAAGFSTMSNAGFTHAKNPNAKAPIVLESFNDVWADHVNEMSRYHGAVPALEDIRRVMNYSFYSESTAESMAIKQLMINSFGQEAADYFNNLYREANSGAVMDKLQKKSKKLLSLFRKSSTAYSLSVWIQQASSIARAYAMVDKKYFGFKGFGTITSGYVKAVSDKWTKAHTNAYNEMLKYAPGVTMAKEIGGFDTHTGGSIRSYLLDTNKSFAQKTKTDKHGKVIGAVKASFDKVDDNVVANLPNLADKIAWIEIWNACKKETVAKHKNLDPNSEEFMQTVGKRFTEVIRATQVYDSIFAKSPIMKSKNLGVQYLVSFWNEPNTTVNMVEKAVRDATRGDWKSGGRIAVAVIYSIVFNNLLKSVIYAMRDDDEDETYIEKYIESMVGGLMADFNPLSYIPLVRDAWSKAQGYDVERPDVAIIGDAIEAFQSKINLDTKDTENMTEEQLIELEKKKDEANWKLAGSVATFFGIPLKNIYREFEGILDHARIASANAGKTTALSAWDKIRDEVIESIPFMKNERTKGDKLYDAIIAGDKAYLDRLKSGYKTEDAYQSAVRKALRENDSRIHAAAQARYDGNTEEYKRIFREIQSEGKFSFDDIMSAINSEESKIRNGGEPDKVTSDYTASGFVQAIITGNISNAQAMKEDIISAKVANGKTKAEAEKEFQSSVQSAVGDAYSAGLLDEARAKEMLKEYAGKDEKEAASKVNYWSFVNAHPQYKSVLSESNVNDYQEFAEPANISLDVFVQYINGIKGLETKYDEWGDVELSVRDQTLEVIDSLPLTWQQKDALYLAAGYAESKIWDVPW